MRAVTRFERVVASCEIRLRNEGTCEGPSEMNLRKTSSAGRGSCRARKCVAWFGVGLIVFVVVAPMARASTTLEGNQFPFCAPVCGSCDECEDSTEDCAGGVAGPEATPAPIFLYRGSAIEKVTDLAMGDVAIPWSHTRTYDSLLAATSGSYPAPNGEKWFMGLSQTYINQESGDIVLYESASNKHVFASNGSGWDAPAYLNATIVKSGSGTSEIYTVTYPSSGKVLIFHGFSSSPSILNGKLKERTSQNLQAASEDGHTYTYHTASSSDPYYGNVKQVMLTSGLKVAYTYLSSGSEAGFLDKVEVKDPTNTDVIKKVEYTYFSEVGSAHSDVGSTGDLVQVKTSHLASDETTWISRYTQYRYYKSTSSDGDVHQLKAVYDSGAIERIIDSNSNISNADAILGKADTYSTGGPAAISAYAIRSFTYYTSNLSTSSSVTTPWGSHNLNTRYEASDLAEDGFVKTEAIGAGCGSCGAAEGGTTRTYFYLENNTLSGIHRVRRIVVEDVEDGASTPTAVYRRIYGLNEKGVALRKAFIEDPDTDENDPSEVLTAWCQSITVGTSTSSPNDYARVLEARSPSAHVLVNTELDLRDFFDPSDTGNDSATLEGSAGVIYVYEYNSDGYRTGSRVKKGSSGTSHYVDAVDWGDGTNDKPEHLTVATYAYHTRTTTRSGGEKTSFVYTFWDAGDSAIKTVETTLPVVPTTRKGSGVATKMSRYYDDRGRLRWTRDGEDRVSYRSYHPDNGRLAYEMRDVNADDTLPSEIQNGLSGKFDGWGSADAPTGFDPVTSDNLELVTKTEYDDLGRTEKTVRPGGSEHYTIYNDGEVISVPYWRSTVSERLSAATVRRSDHGGDRTEVFSVPPAEITSSGGVPTGLSAGQDDYLSWIRWTHDDVTGREEYVDRYHLIPATGDGSVSTNFYRTVRQYDDLGREQYLIQVVSGELTTGVEQVTKTTYDVLGRVTKVERGVSASGSGNSMGSDYSSKPTLAIVSETEFDGGNVGDGHISKVVSYHGTDTAEDKTWVEFHRTFRGHLRGEERYHRENSTDTTVAPHLVHDIDWKGAITATATFKANPSWSTILSGDDGYDDYADYSGVRTNRVSLVAVFRDDLHRVYRKRVYEVDSSGDRGSSVRNDIYYDRNSRVAIEHEYNGSSVEHAYDGVGRRYQTRTVADSTGTGYNTTTGAVDYHSPEPKADLSDMTGGDDKIVEIVHREFDDAGNVTGVHRFEMNHDDSTAGVDFTADDDYVRTTEYFWYDRADRRTTAASYGSGGSTWDYHAVPTRGTAPTASSATVLVSEFSYTLEGQLESVTDAEDTVTSYLYDDLGRATQEERDDDGTDEVILEIAYDGLDNVVEREDGANNATTYLFEDVYDAARVTNVIHPDSTDTTSAGTDQEKLTYNLDGTVKDRTDQRGVKLEFEYNGQRRVELQKATIPSGSDVDDAVKSLKYEYDGIGRLETSSSYQSADGTGTPLNQVKFEYNDLGQLSKSYQEHDGNVYTSTSPVVEYSYAALSDRARLAHVKYPAGREIHLDYGGSNSVTDRLHRFRGFESDTGTEYVTYEYNGLRRLVEADYVGPGVSLDYDHGSADEYEGFDRFGRVVDHYWKGTTDIDRFRYDYDYAGNPNYRDIDLPTSVFSADDKDQDFEYDALHRLTSYDRGTLSGSSIGSPNFAQDWTLDDLGNWDPFKWDPDGSGAASLITQSRDHNDANEIDTTNDHSDAAGNSISGTGADWVDPVYDASGNLVEGPRAGDETTRNTYVYDAWNRLVEVKDGSTTLAEYEHDALFRRIASEDQGSSGNPTKHYFYNAAWQVVEVRLETSSVIDPDPLEQFVWHPYYIDAAAVRFYDSDVNGSSVTHYYTNDTNANVTALVNSSGSAIERYEYEPYGQVTVLDADFTDDSDSPVGETDYDNFVLYTGQWWDGELAGYWYRFRNYAPTLGRFLQRDPIGVWGDGGALGNGYSYVGGRATSFRDPSGAEGDPSSVTISGEVVFKKRFSIKFETTVRCEGPKVIHSGVDQAYQVDFDTSDGGMERSWVESDIDCGEGHPPGIIIHFVGSRYDGYEGYIEKFGIPGAAVGAVAYGAPVLFSGAGAAATGEAAAKGSAIVGAITSVFGALVTMAFDESWELSWRMQWSVCCKCITQGPTQDGGDLDDVWWPVVKYMKDEPAHQFSVGNEPAFNRGANPRNVTSTHSP